MPRLFWVLRLLNCYKLAKTAHIIFTFNLFFFFFFVVFKLAPKISSIPQLENLYMTKSKRPKLFIILCLRGELVKGFALIYHSA